MVIEEGYLVAKAKAEELSNDNEDLLKKISDVMNKVSKLEKLRFEVEENTKAITERKKALKKELQEVKKAIEDKSAKLKGYVAADNAKVQAAYYQDQYDCIASVKPEVQHNLQVYFSKGWIAALDKMQVEASFALRQADNIPIPSKLIIASNLEIQAIINDESPVLEVEGASPTVVSGGDMTSSAVVSTTKVVAQP